MGGTSYTHKKYEKTAEEIEAEEMAEALEQIRQMEEKGGCVASPTCQVKF